MNELDSELVRGSLAALGYRFIDDPAAADVVLYNTCSVREQAENKVWSRVGLMGLRKKEGERFILGVIGCMAEREGTSMLRRFPQVDLMCGPGELDKLPLLIDNAMKTEAGGLHARRESASHDRVALQGSNSRRSSTLAAAEDNLELLDLSRAFDPDRAQLGAGRSAYVRITRGCNKFCTYCVVPYTRGAEVHRAPDAIVDECRRLADAGVIEVTLLGQTVNHYAYVHGAAVSTDGIELPQIGPAFQNGHAKTQATSVPSPAVGNNPKTKIQNPKSARATTFADLLKRIHDEVPAIQRLRFVTSFPRDFGDDILQVIAESPRICRYLHVPAQSGSNRMLKLMNRGYTVEEYLDFLARARAFLPDACIAGDFIVGFPGETEEDFAQTKDLARQARYKNAFIFKYSPRPGTVAIKRFTDDVPADVKRRRNHELLALQAQISASVHAEWVGRTVDVFVEHVNERPAKAASALARPFGNVQLGWERLHPDDAHDTAHAETRVQMSGRTGGDLIVAFDVSATHRDLGARLPAQVRGREVESRGSTLASALVGRIVPVKIFQSSTLILRGDLLEDSPIGSVNRGQMAIQAGCQA